MAQGELNKKIAFSITKHLQSQVSSGTLDEDGKEGIEIAVQCICQAYGINTESEEDKSKYGVKPTLEEVFSGLSVEESKKKAEVFKQQGNVHLKFDKYNDAIDCYTKAIDLDPSNATYYCNRAAAYIKIERLDTAVDDCKKALSLNPSYARAHGRLGYIYSSQGKFELSKECFKKALQLDPENESYRTNLETVEEQLRFPPSSAPPEGGGGGGAGAVGGGDGAEGGAVPGGFGGLLNMVQNPAFMNMASNLMQTPAFQNMASQMLSRGMVPNMADMANVPPEMMSGVTDAARDMQQNNPEMFQNLQQQVFQGLQQQQQQQQAPQGQGGNSTGASKDSSTKKD